MPRGKNNNGLPNAGCFKAGDPKLKVKTPAHRAAISAGQKKAWQTKRQTDAGGYVRVKIAEGKWKLDHVLVMERVLGRPIQPGEIVHHIDGNRSNNDESNLHLCRNHAEHMWLEKQIKGLFREMMRRGLVKFNRKLGVYECP